MICKDDISSPASQFSHLSQLLQPQGLGTMRKVVRLNSTAGVGMLRIPLQRWRVPLQTWRPGGPQGCHAQTRLQRRPSAWSQGTQTAAASAPRQPRLHMASGYLSIPQEHISQTPSHVPSFCLKTLVHVTSCEKVRAYGHLHCPVDLYAPVYAPVLSPFSISRFVFPAIQGPGCMTR